MTDREKLIAILPSDAACVTLGIDGCDVCPHKNVADCYTAALVDHLLANGVVVREKGEWVNNSDGYPECNRCGYKPQYDPMFDDIYYSDFCPSCGADMTGGERNV